VEINGINVIDKRKEANQILGYIPDIPFMYPKLTGREFLEFVGSLYKVEKETMNKKISELERALEISWWLDGLMEVSPRGVRQKIMLAAMLLHSPRVLLLDEPTANLDPKSARLVKELLQKMTQARQQQQQQRVTILLSTHILEIAQNLCQRMVILDKGKVVASGTMEELRQIAKSPESNLEDIFLRLTGGEAYSELLRYIS
jgi:ABC-2 type transport system ATP-binding protein